MTKTEFIATGEGRAFLVAMRLAGLRPVTRNNYARRISVVLSVLGKTPERLTAEDPSDYVARAAEAGKSNIDVATTCVALRFFMTRILKKDWRLEQFPRVHKYRKQKPRPLTREEIVLILRHTQSRRSRLLFSIIYGSGLRLGEACNLRISDIDLQHHRVYIRDGKGGRHRENVLPRKLNEELRSYIALRRPGEWLFPSNRKIYEGDTLFPVVKETRPVSTRGTQHEFNLIRRRLNLAGLVTIHSLRHSFATHLVEHSMPLFSVQRLLGHQHLSTTLGYLTSTEKPVIADFSPFDQLHPAPE